MQPKKLLVKLGVLAVIILALIFVKWELKVSQDCEIAALEYYTISNQADAFMEEQLFSEGEEEKRQTNVLKLISAEYGVVNLEPLVKEGQKVHKGDLIAQVSSNQYKNEMATTMAMIDKAKADYAILKKGARPEELQQANDNIRRIEALLKAKQKEKERFDQLWEKKLVSQEEYDKVLSEYQALESDLAIAKNTLRLLQLGAKPEELAEAKAEIQQLQATANFLKQQIQAQEIKSPISGTVTNVRPKGDLISIARMDTVRVLIWASEKDMDVVKAGQKVKAKVRSYPGKSFYGVVTKVAQQAEKLGNKNVFIISSKVSNNDSHLKPGMTGQAKIYCGKRSLINLLTRKIIRWFRVEVWSWF
jgi:multidrug efflux pump subunit AcrA (membrane-fusion protein)